MRLGSCVVVALWLSLAQGAEPFRVTIAEGVDPLSASVKVAVRDGDTTYHGSGTIVESDTERASVLTCWHTFRGVSSAAITTVEHASLSHAAVVVKQTPEHDLALLEITTQRTLPAVRLAFDVPNVGETLLSCGRDESGKLTAEATRLTAVDRYDVPLNLECNQFPPLGRSGGGLFNAAGQLVGVLQGRRPDARVALYVRLPAVRELLGRPAAAGPEPARRRRVLAFTAKWCVPCNSQISFKNEAAPWLRKSGWQIDSTERAHVQIVDIDEHPELAQQFGVETVPSFVLIENGMVKSRDTYRGKLTVVNLFARDDSPESSQSPQVKVVPRLSGPVVSEGHSGAPLMYQMPFFRGRRR